VIFDLILIINSILLTDKYLVNEYNQEQKPRVFSEERVMNDSVSEQKYKGRRFYNRRKRHFSPLHSATKKNEEVRFNKISIVIPVYNEEESVNPLANEIRKALYQTKFSYEVIFVDDGSTDRSLKEIKDICKTDKRFKYLSFRKNYGKSAALQVGFISSTGDVIVTMDSDLQDDPSEIQNLLKKLSEGYDLVSGWKKVRHDPFIKRYSSKFFNFVTRLISRVKIHDFNCGLKAYRREVIENIQVYGELHRYLPLLAHWQGYRIAEVVVKHHPRRYGKTKFGVSRFFKGFIDLITVVFTTRYIKRPMHLFGFFGALAFFAGIIVNGYLTYLWISGVYLTNRPLLFLGILLIIVGVQFFSVGLLGEMFVHNSRNEKEYIIKEKS
jgi:glycosyltransferase involved in cell wall biosynthesis